MARGGCDSDCGRNGGRFIGPACPTQVPALADLAAVTRASLPPAQHPSPNRMCAMFSSDPAYNDPELHSIDVFDVGASQSDQSSLRKPKMNLASFLFIKGWPNIGAAPELLAGGEMQLMK